MLKSFNRYANVTQLGKLWLCRKCSKVFKLKLLYFNPTPDVEPKWYLTPCAFMILNARPHRILLNIFAPISIRVTPCNVLGLDKSPLFGTVPCIVYIDSVITRGLFLELL